MIDRSRLFEAAPDPFGRMWQVQFRWLQTGISIRHADTVDVKFLVTPTNGEPQEKVIAMAHSDLLALCASRNRKLSDPLCMRLAAEHLRRMIETTEDMDKTLVTLKADELGEYERQIRSETVRQHA